MTAILDEIRRLEAAKNRGELSPAEYAAAKSRLMETVEDADTGTPAVIAQDPGPAKPIRAFDVITFLIIASFACLGIATLILGDLMLAITLTLTLLAAFTVRAFLTLDD